MKHTLRSYRQHLRFRLIYLPHKKVWRVFITNYRTGTRQRLTTAKRHDCILAIRNTIGYLG